VRVRVLGPVDVETSAGEVLIGSAKERLLLAALAVNRGHVVTADALIDALWGEKPPDTARKTLQTHVSNLRRRLGSDVVVTEPSGYRLRVDDVDVDRFRDLVREGEHATRDGDVALARAKFADAVALWRGEPFVDAASDSALAAERVRLHEEHLSALEARVAADLDAGAHNELVGELEGLVREHPFRERLWAHLMVALYRSGRQADALASYQRARTVLADELGLEPGADLRRLERAVLEQDAALDLAAPVRVPVDARVARAPVRFAQTADGVNVAYQVVGTGDRAIVTFPMAALLPFDAIDDEPAAARFHDRLASLGRLIRFDPRGIGFSDPLVSSTANVLEQWVHDAITVMDAAACQDAVVFASMEGTLAAILMATTYPDRVRGLVLVNGTARLARDVDYPIGMPQHVIDDFLDINFDPDAVAHGFDFLEVAAPSVVHDPAFREWWITAGHRGASPAAARAIQTVHFGADVRALAPLVRVPTLVLHRQATAGIRVTHGRYMGEHIPGARYVELAGADDLPWVGDTSVMLGEITEFFARAHHEASTDRVLTTIVFVEIVDEDPGAAVDRYDAMVARQLDRFGGRPRSGGTGRPLATFDGPARAVTCTCAIRDAASQLGLHVRAAVHTGEVELSGPDIRGVAVDLGADVLAAAQPDEVVVSRTVVDLVAGSGLRFDDRGLHPLGDPPEGWRLFAAS